VSRTLTQLQIAGLITLAGCRSIHLRKPAPWPNSAPRAAALRVPHPS